MNKEMMIIDKPITEQIPDKRKYYILPMSDPGIRLNPTTLSEQEIFNGARQMQIEHFPSVEGKKGYRQLSQDAKASRRNLRILSWPDGVRGAIFLPKNKKNVEGVYAIDIYHQLHSVIYNFQNQNVH